MTARWRKWYLLYVTRNGQHLWEGPFTSKRRAGAALNMRLDAHDPVLISPGIIVWPRGKRVGPELASVKGES